MRLERRAVASKGPIKCPRTPSTGTIGSSPGVERLRLVGLEARYAGGRRDPPASEAPAARVTPLRGEGGCRHVRPEHALWSRSSSLTTVAAWVS